MAGLKENTVSKDFIIRILSFVILCAFFYAHFATRILIFHPHFVIRVFPYSDFVIIILASSFYYPHFVFRILSSAYFHPPSAIRHPPSAIRHPPSAISHRGWPGTFQTERDSGSRSKITKLKTDSREDPSSICRMLNIGRQFEFSMNRRWKRTRTKTKTVRFFCFSTAKG